MREIQALPLCLRSSCPGQRVEGGRGKQSLIFFPPMPASPAYALWEEIPLQPSPWSCPTMPVSMPWCMFGFRGLNPSGVPPAGCGPCSAPAHSVVTLLCWRSLSIWPAHGSLASALFAQSLGERLEGTRVCLALGALPWGGRDAWPASACTKPWTVFLLWLKFRDMCATMDFSNVKVVCTLM